MFVEDKYGVVDRWHPKSADRLATLLSSIPGTILISGDVHQAEMIHYPCSSKLIREATSSGLTHSVISQWGFLGALYNYLLLPFTWNVSPRFLVKNFGTVDITWGNDPIVTLNLREDDGKILYSEEFTVSGSLVSPKYSDLCDYSAKERFGRHVLGAVVLVMPVILWTAAGVIYLRKYSHSY